MRFKINPRLPQQIERQPQHRVMLVEQAEVVKATATALAPHRTGYYKRRFYTDDDGLRVTVGNTDPFAHLVEWGSANNFPYAVLRRAVRRSGLEMREDPKGAE